MLAGHSHHSGKLKCWRGGGEIFRPAKNAPRPSQQKNCDPRGGERKRAGKNCSLLRELSRIRRYLCARRESVAAAVPPIRNVYPLIRSSPRSSPRAGARAIPCAPQFRIAEPPDQGRNRSLRQCAENCRLLSQQPAIRWRKGSRPVASWKFFAGKRGSALKTVEAPARSTPAERAQALVRARTSGGLGGAPASRVPGPNWACVTMA